MTIKELFFWLSHLLKKKLLSDEGFQKQFVRYHKYDKYNPYSLAICYANLRHIESSRNWHKISVISSFIGNIADRRFSPSDPYKQYFDKSYKAGKKFTISAEDVPTPLLSKVYQIYVNIWDEEIGTIACVFTKVNR
uniref:Uncharacterized protein n=1 Tax=Rhizophagus irregularis (strain DAOM 181602 / DAOM 197198 / MUCL 43194) TaxID=747089 RepID=U9THL6_RHIID